MLASPLTVRAAVRAARSAASWVWVLAIASMLEVDRQGQEPDHGHHRDDQKGQNGTAPGSEAAGQKSNMK